MTRGSSGCKAPVRDPTAFHYLVAHEEPCGPGGLDPDAHVSFSVGGQDVALVVDDLEKEACQSLPRRTCPARLPHLSMAWLLHGTPGTKRGWGE